MPGRLGHTTHLPAGSAGVTGGCLGCAAPASSDALAVAGAAVQTHPPQEELPGGCRLLAAGGWLLAAALWMPAPCCTALNLCACPQTVRPLSRLLPLPCIVQSLLSTVVMEAEGSTLLGNERAHQLHPRLWMFLGCSFVVIGKLPTAAAGAAAAAAAAGTRVTVAGCLSAVPSLARTAAAPNSLSRRTSCHPRPLILQAWSTWCLLPCGTFGWGWRWALAWPRWAPACAA